MTSNDYGRSATQKSLDSVSSAFKIISKQRKQLTEILQEHLEVVLDELLVQDVITEEEYETLDKTEEESKKKSRKLVIIIQKKGEKACFQFLELLEMVRPGSRQFLQQSREASSSTACQMEKECNFKDSAQISEESIPENPDVVSVSNESKNPEEDSWYEKEDETTQKLQQGNNHHAKASPSTGCHNQEEHARSLVDLAKTLEESITGNPNLVMSPVPNEIKYPEDDLYCEEKSPLEDVESKSEETASEGFLLPNDKIAAKNVKPKEDNFKDLQKEILSKFESLDIESKLSRLSVKPQDEIFKQVFGCGKQCPFCKVPCEAGGDAHKDHFAAVHRPGGLGEYRDTDTWRLISDICSSQVASQKKFKCADTNWEFYPYKDYRDYYPDWCIQADPSLNASDYWKFVLKEFNTEFSKKYKAKRADLPKDWEKITKEQALQALKQSYNMK